MDHKIILSLQKSLKSFTLWAKPKKPNKVLLKPPLKPITTWHLLKLVATRHSKTRCYTTPLKSLLLHDTSKSLLLHDNIVTKSYRAQMLFWHLFTKTQILFWQLHIKPNTILAHIYKAQVLFWQLLIKPNNTLAPIYKSPNIILAKTITLSSKAQNYFLAKTYLQILKSLTHGKYKLLIFRKYFFYKIYGNYSCFFP